MADCPVISITKAHTRRGQIGTGFLTAPPATATTGFRHSSTAWWWANDWPAAHDPSRRIAYAIVEGRFSHHHASAQMFPHEQGSLVVWITDLLPDTLAEAARAMMDHGAEVMTRTLAD